MRSRSTDRVLKTHILVALTRGRNHGCVRGPDRRSIEVLAQRTEARCRPDAVPAVFIDRTGEAKAVGEGLSNPEAIRAKLLQYNFVLRPSAPIIDLLRETVSGGI